MESHRDYLTSKESVSLESGYHQYSSLRWKTLATILVISRRKCFQSFRFVVVFYSLSVSILTYLLWFIYEPNLMIYFEKYPTRIRNNGRLRKLVETLQRVGHQIDSWSRAKSLLKRTRMVQKSTWPQRSREWEIQKLFHLEQRKIVRKWHQIAS